MHNVGCLMSALVGKPTYTSALMVFFSLILVGSTNPYDVLRQQPNHQQLLKILLVEWTEVLTARREGQLL